MRILNTMAARAMPLVPRSLIRKISRRYIAGETLCDARTRIRALPLVPLSRTRKTPRRYIAGETLCDARTRIRALHATGFRTTVDVLGETASSSDQTESMARDY